MLFETATVEMVTEMAPEWAAFVFAALSYFGSVWFVAPAIALAYWFGNRRRFASWFAIVIGGYAVMVGTKTFFDISRPEIEPAVAPESLPTLVAHLYAPMVEVETTTFPSGHALAAVVIWTMIALETDWGSRRTRLTGAAVMVALVGISRVGVAVHYPVDVVVGTALGVTYVAGALAVRSVIRDRVSRRAVPSVLFGLAAALSALAFALGGGVDAAALAGGALGALVGWRVLGPPDQPWKRPHEGVVAVVVGLGVLGASALVAVQVDLTAVWFALGLLGGVVVSGIPALNVRRPLWSERAQKVSR